MPASRTQTQGAVSFGEVQKTDSPPILEIDDDPEILELSGKPISSLEAPSLGGELVNVTIFFADVRGFTRALEKLSPIGVVNLLNLYFVPYVEEITAAGGTIDKFIGDAVLAVWGAPEPAADHADRAVETAVRIQRRILAMNAEREAKGLVMLNFGIGITTGEVLAGNIGTINRTTWTVIGAPVNLASRISSVAWGYRVLVSPETKAALTDLPYKTRECEPLKFKGFRQTVIPHSVLWHEGHSGPTIEQDLAGTWYLWNGAKVIGPFLLAQLIRLPDFSAETLVSRSDKSKGDFGWKPWFKAARNLRVWLTQSTDGPKGVFTLDEIVRFHGNTPDHLVRVQGDSGWRRLGEMCS